MTFKREFNVDQTSLISRRLKSGQKLKSPTSAFPRKTEMIDFINNSKLKNFFSASSSFNARIWIKKFSTGTSDVFSLEYKDSILTSLYSSKHFCLGNDDGKNRSSSSICSYVLCLATLGASRILNNFSIDKLMALLLIKYSPQARK